MYESDDSCLDGFVIFVAARSGVVSSVSIA